MTKLNRSWQVWGQLLVAGKVMMTNPKRVLIVEDEADALELLRDWTEAQGWSVRTARTGHTALEVGRIFKPDIVITDYTLEGDINGLDVIEGLRREGSGRRCVLVTGVLGNALGENVRRLHGVPILTKPFDLERLAELTTG
jgi:DNA-binding response OmpR family regulator